MARAQSVTLSHSDSRRGYGGPISGLLVRGSLCICVCLSVRVYHVYISVCVCVCVCVISGLVLVLKSVLPSFLWDGCVQ